MKFEVIKSPRKLILTGAQLLDYLSDKLSFDRWREICEWTPKIGESKKVYGITIKRIE